MKRLSAHLQDLQRGILTLAVGAVGGGLFYLIGAPAPWLTGAVTATGLAAFMGLPAVLPPWLRTVSFVFIGANMGAAVTPETLALIWRWPFALVGLAVVVWLIIWAGGAYLERVHGFDPTTARLAAIPGQFSYVMSLASELQCDSVKVMIVQILRLAAVVLLIPVLLSVSGIAPSGPPPAVVARGTLDAIQLALLLAFAIAGGYLFQRLKFPASHLFGSMFGAAVLYGPGFLVAMQPDWMLAPAFVTIGCMVGSNFYNLDRKLLADLALASVGNVAVGSAIALAFALPASTMLDLPTAQMWLAYAPGGVETMAIMALALGYDAAFVGAHHAVRLFLLSVYVPWWIRGLCKRESK